MLYWSWGCSPLVEHFPGVLKSLGSIHLVLKLSYFSVLSTWNFCSSLWKLRENILNNKVLGFFPFCFLFIVLEILLGCVTTELHHSPFYFFEIGFLLPSFPGWPWIWDPQVWVTVPREFLTVTNYFIRRKLSFLLSWKAIVS